MKDYLHFYIGQWGTLKKSTARHDINYYQDGRYILNGSIYHEIRCFDHEFILELRPLSDISEEEAIELAKLNAFDYGFDTYEVFEKDEYSIRYLCREKDDDCTCDWRLYFCRLNAEQFAYLLSKGFDVYGLKEKGLAIYKTDVK
jgi:hypothetical protein